MRVGGRGAWVLAAAAALGVVGGLTAAVVLPQASGPSTAVADPLGLGIPLMNLQCTGRSIMVVGWGSSRAPLDAAVADNAAADARYLRREDSCPTLYSPIDKELADYVVYLGPYDSRLDACEQRLTLEHKGDNVTLLDAGNQTFVKCICVLPPGAGPVLSVGMVASADDGIWIRGVQGLLNDIGRLPEEAITGVYDERTAAVVRRIQANAAVLPDGVVDEVTWKLLRDRACSSYDY